MSYTYLKEAFTKLDALNEDKFQLNDKGIEEFSDFSNMDVDDKIDIIDPDAEKEEDVKDSYIGKVVLDCCVCHSQVFKSKEEIVQDENSEDIVNKDDECPYCYSQEGFKILGEIKPFEEDNKESEKPEIADDTLEVADKEEPKDVNENLNTLAKKMLGEGLDKLEMCLDGKKIEVSVKDKCEEELEEKEASPKETEEVIRPIEIEPNEEGKDSDEVDIDIDDFEENSFDELGEKYLKEVYENVASYKTTSISQDPDNCNKLKVEGLITFKSNKTKPTTFVFESYKMTKSGKVKFLGENKNFSKGKKAFALTGSVKNKNFISESLTYNYRAKADKGNTISRIYGTVKVGK